MWLIRVSICLLLLPASAGADDLKTAPARIAVLPFLELGSDKDYADAFRRRFNQNLLGQYHVDLIPSEGSDRVVWQLCGDAKKIWECLGIEENLFEIASRLGVRFVVSGRFAIAGDRKLFRLQIVDGQTKRVSSEVMEFPAEGPAQVPAGLAFLERMLPVKPAPESTSHWRSWVIAGASVAAIAGVLSVILFSSKDSTDWRDEWDLFRTLP